MRFRQVALLTIGVVAVSFSAIFIRLAHAPSLTIALYRNAFAAAVMLPLAMVKRPDEFRRLTRRQWTIAVVSGAVLAVHFAVWISSLSYTTIAASVVLVTASPILVAGAERTMFGERTSGRAMAGIMVGLAGVAVISGGDLFVLSRRAAGGDLLALAGAAAAGAYFVAGRTLRQEVSLVTYAGIVYATCAVLLLPMAALSGAPLTGFPVKTWGLFMLMALVPQSLGHTVFNYLLGQVRATVIAVAVMGEPVGATLLGLAIFREVPPWTAFVGGVLILAGIYVAATAQGGRRRAAGEAVVPLE